MKSKYSWQIEHNHFDPSTGLHTEVCIDKYAKYGFFEQYIMRKSDDEYLHEGGLWFEFVLESHLELVDQDGTYTLPRTVGWILRQHGIQVDKDFE